MYVQQSNLEESKEAAAHMPCQTATYDKVSENAVAGSINLTDSIIKQVREYAENINPDRTKCRSALRSRINRKIVINHPTEIQDSYKR